MNGEAVVSMCFGNFSSVQGVIKKAVASNYTAAVCRTEYFSKTNLPQTETAECTERTFSDARVCSSCCTRPCLRALWRHRSPNWCHMPPGFDNWDEFDTWTYKMMVWELYLSLDYRINPEDFLICEFCFRKISAFGVCHYKALLSLRRIHAWTLQLESF